MQLALGSHDRQPAAQRIVDCRWQPLPPAAVTARRLSTELDAIRFDVEPAPDQV